jgi:hypothetical protein
MGIDPGNNVVDGVKNVALDLEWCDDRAISSKSSIRRI